MRTAEFEQMVNERGLTLDELAEALERLPVRTAARATDDERQVLRRLGVDPDAHSDVPAAAGLARRAQLEAVCLSVDEAAEWLGRDASRVRQRLAGADRSLLGWHRQGGAREWRLPRFQFEWGLHDSPEWARLLRALPHPDATSPVALVDWLTDPQAHLDGRSRAEALADGELEGLLAEAAAYDVVP